MIHDDDRAPDEVRRALAGYRPPPPMPADEMWAAIQTGTGAADPHPPIPLSPWTRRIRPRVVTALAASLALFIAGTGVGFGVARARDDGDAPERIADGGAAEAPVLYRVTWF
ncbi:hypothetical protein [Longimicrobium sp.]|uniref:hypothetical protein n=1 Tax=Longimicrobium sp. TaxID=2029185 RepID=UPI003B3B582B